MRKEERDRCEREERSVDRGITACRLRERARKSLGSEENYVGLYTAYGAQGRDIYIYEAWSVARAIEAGGQLNKQRSHGLGMTLG